MSSPLPILLALFVAVGAATQALAFQATLTSASPVEAHPAGSVARNELAPIEGVAVAPPRAVAVPYEIEVIAPIRTIPVPSFNSASVAWCPSDVL